MKAYVAGIDQYSVHMSVTVYCHIQLRSHCSDKMYALVGEMSVSLMRSARWKNSIHAKIHDNNYKKTIQMLAQRLLRFCGLAPKVLKAVAVSIVQFTMIYAYWLYKQVKLYELYFQTRLQLRILGRERLCSGLLGPEGTTVLRNAASYVLVQRHSVTSQKTLSSATSQQTSNRASYRLYYTGSY
jgi:hypothetical protein